MIAEQLTPIEIKSILNTSFLSDLNEKFIYLPETGQLVYRKSGQLAGKLQKSGYLLVTFRERSYPVPRLIYCIYYGYMPRGQIDHINRIKTDNRIANLRDVSAATNAKNKSPGSNNKSGVVGVTWNKDSNCWYAKITHERKQIQIGAFKNFINAVKARHYAEQKLDYATGGVQSSAELYLNNAARMTFHTNIELTTKKECNKNAVESEWQFFCYEKIKKIDNLAEQRELKREKLVESLIHGR